MGKSAAKNQEEAITQQRALIQKATDEAKGYATQYGEKAQGWLKPFYETGVKANQSLSDILADKLNVDDVVQSSSLFKFQQETGSRDINRQLRARGLYGSGAGLETLAKFENQLLGEESERYMGRLFQLSNSGQQAGGQLSHKEMTTGNSLADIAIKGGFAQGGVQAAIGDARASGNLAWGQMGQGIASAIQGGLNSGLQYNMYKPVLDKWAGKTDEEAAAAAQAAGEHQEDLGRYIVANTRMPNVPGNEAGKWSSFADIPTGRAWSNF